jgi:hypothetical protein
MELLGSQEVENALLEGVNKRSCSYHCREMPESYRHPGRIITGIIIYLPFKKLYMIQNVVH